MNIATHKGKTGIIQKKNLSYSILCPSISLPLLCLTCRERQNHLDTSYGLGKVQEKQRQTILEFKGKKLIICLAFDLC